MIIDKELLKKEILSGESMLSLANKYNVGKTTIQKYKKSFNFSSEELHSIREAELLKRSLKLKSKHTQYLSYYVNDSKESLIAKISSLTEELNKLKSEPFLDSVSPVYRGVAAELYAQYRLIKRGIEVIKAPHYFKASDLFILKKNGKVLKCEVKATSKGNIVKLARTNYNSTSKSFTPRKYEDGEVDYFIVVLLEFERIFIIPFEETKHKSKSINLSPNSYFWKFKDRFDLLQET